MVEEYFGFSGPPFKLSPDTKFFFGSKSHTKAMAYLHYGLRQAEGFIVITGEIGAGKSMLIEHMQDQLNRSNVSVAHLLTTNLEPQDLLSHILSAFKIEAAGSGRSAELEAFEDFLYDNVNRGCRVLLVVDEAQNLPVPTIEELRMLTNINHQGTPLFQVFLVGQPEFRDVLSQENMEQLRQRVIASYHLEALEMVETREYIEHRLAIVGRREEPHFTEEAFEAIHQHTGGVPRRINTLCTRLLLFCSLEKRNLINSAVVKSIAKELSEEITVNIPTPSLSEPSVKEPTAKETTSSEKSAATPEAANEVVEENQVIPLTPAAVNGATIHDVRDALAALGDKNPVHQGAIRAQQQQKSSSTEVSQDSQTTDAAPSSVMDQILKMRTDLREAHKGNRDIHRALSDIEDHQEDNVIKIENHLATASAILSELEQE